MKRSIHLVVIAMVMLPLMIGCAKKITVEEILVKSSQVMEAVQTVRFTLERRGDPVTITLAEGQSVGLVGAAGEYAFGNAHAIVKVDIPLLGRAEAEVVWVADQGYVKAPPIYSEYTPFALEGFSLTNIFSGQGSLSHLLATQLTSPTLVGEEEIEGTRTYHVQDTVDSAALPGLTAGYIAEGTATLHIWIDWDTFEVVRIVINEPGDSGWQLDFFSYGIDLTIIAPTVIGQ